MKTKIILILLFVAMLAVLLAQNTAIVTYRLFFWTVSLSQVVLVPVVAVIGFLLGLAVGALRRKRGGPKP
jgi:uncharacterized integral membrane protein